MKTTKISGYSVEISTCGDSTNCWIEKGTYSASLAVLQDYGYLERAGCGEHRVNPDVIDRITEWAEANGY
jgi:hypothetical protein